MSSPSLANFFSSTHLEEPSIRFRDIVLVIISRSRISRRKAYSDFRSFVQRKEFLNSLNSVRYENFSEMIDRLIKEKLVEERKNEFFQSYELYTSDRGQGEVDWILMRIDHLQASIS